MLDPLTSPELPVKPGEVLAGKYRIERIIGIGGMGVVAAAYHLQLDQVVALKFLLPGAIYDPEAIARFAREARAAVKIRSEHVARVIDVGQLEDGGRYLVMEYLEGGDLASVIRARGALPVHEAVEYVLQACEAIAEAHALGIVHRDLKPANIFLAKRADGSPIIKVLDFGISKFLPASGSGSDLGITRTAAIIGSPLYMSPEQLSSSRDVDARADIWSLGVILFELLAGEVPFVGDTLPQLCTRILQANPPSLRELKREVPEGLEKVITRCLKADRGARYPNVAGLASELVAFAPPHARVSADRISRLQLGIDSASLHKTAVSASGESPPVDARKAGSTAAPWSNVTAKGHRKRSILALGALAVVGIVLTVARSIVHRDVPPSTSPGMSLPSRGITDPRNAPDPAERSFVRAEPSALPLTPPAVSAQGHPNVATAGPREGNPDASTGPGRKREHPGAHATPPAPPPSEPDDVFNSRR